MNGIFSVTENNSRTRNTEAKAGTCHIDAQICVWCGNDKCEFRDANDAVTLFAYPQGQYSGGTRYYYTRDHLGSIREMGKSDGTIVARYDYDPWGRSTTVINTTLPDFNFTGLYRHSASGLIMAERRFYDPDLGRWISRDPIGENGGVNLYAYTSNDPVDGVDTLGLDTYRQRRQIGGSNMAGLGQFFTHTFIFTTNPDGTLANTYSWGNTANNTGWNQDQSEDRDAANQALGTDSGFYLNRVGDGSLDPFIDLAFSILSNDPAHVHRNGWYRSNCKSEASDLTDLANQLRLSLLLLYML
jgi:RHS repeat-associated protein